MKDVMHKNRRIGSIVSLFIYLILFFLLIVAGFLHNTNLFLAIVFVLFVYTLIMYLLVLNIKRVDKLNEYKNKE